MDGSVSRSQNRERAEPIVYEDFLPVSAAGIFRSNLGGTEQRNYQANERGKPLSATSADRVVFATDNSIYQVTPQAVVFPRHESDVVRVARLSAEERFQSIAFTHPSARADRHAARRSHRGPRASRPGDQGFSPGGGSPTSPRSDTWR